MSSGFRGFPFWLHLSSTPAPVPTVPELEAPAKTDYEFYLKHLGRDGTVKQAVLNPLWCRYTKAKYGGRLEFGLNASATEVATFEDYDLVEIWWRNLRLGIQDTTVPSGRGFVRDGRFIFREWGYNTGDDGITMATGYCVSKWDVLAWRRNLWAEGTANRSSFEGVAAETIGKTIVSYNATTLALASSGRFRDGDLAAGMGFTIVVATDGGRGNSREKKFDGGTLRDQLVGIAQGGGGDFTLEWTDTTELTLDWQDTIQGEDKTSTVIFSLEKFNMVRPRLRQRKMGRPTVAIATGQGRADARITTDPVEGADYASNNDIELYVDARDLDTEAGLEARADEKLIAVGPTTDLTFGVQQTTDTFYTDIEVPGRNTYTVGDLVTAQHFGTYQLEVRSVTVDWQRDRPTITPELAGYVPEPGPDGREGLDAAFDAIVRTLEEQKAELSIFRARPPRPKNEYAGGGAPTVNDDITGGFSPGSEWTDEVAGDIYKMSDNAAGAAVWTKLNP